MVAKRPAANKGASQKKTIPVRTTGTGQHAPSSGRCISTSLRGKPCMGLIPSDATGKFDGVPYCSTCRKTGDPSLRVTDHPKFGKILVAARDLPARYYMAWWGTVRKKKDMPLAHWEWALETRWGIIDARPHQGGSLLQFSACPGPNEITTVWMGPNSESQMQKAPVTCMMFSTRMAVPKNHNLTMMYNVNVKTTDEFFAERGLVRADVGTEKFPALRKQGL